ncbi:hypothetical protein LTR56_006696 [Elasticomyces elasticus]|nr:hypothetical protein LTR22_017707 [Elasticomyces elasticus]KAK3649797.1 hypothetical protein LTR56_006696 [Elasticomyces elasticus]KAK4913065.1 hypothetical protein LTR49_018531 [Elasticomyces elasticus]KAK5762489.1 hypothetical protein LTS12_007280 [Elasticomyces elasticus]
MLSLPHVSVFLAVFESLAAAQDFTPLSNYNDYGALQNCQQMCLDNGTSSGKYGTVDTAKSNCGDLITQLDEVNSCVDDSLGQGCQGNSSAAIGAQSILAVYCTSEIGLKFGETIPATTISGPTSATAADSTAVQSPSGAVATGDGGPGVTPTTTDGNPTGTPSVASAGATSTVEPVSKSVTGLTSGAKAGIGVGIGLGIPIIIGAIAAWWLLNKRKKTRAAGGPYDPVLASEKRHSESGSYSSPQMAPREMHPMPPAAPFLPAAGAREIPQHEESYTPTPVTMKSRHLPYSDEPGLGPGYGSTRSSIRDRPSTSRDVSRGATPPLLDTQARPQTAHPRLAPPDDEPPSPVSPISPVDSRPASLLRRHSDERHD